MEFGVGRNPDVAAVTEEEEMGVLDSVLNDARTELGLSSRSAGSVLSGLLTFINQDIGGINGFLDRFRGVGKSNLLGSWLSGDAKPVAPDTVERAIGHDAIDRIASRADVSFSAAASAIALMLPKLIGKLAPSGVIPSRLSAELSSYITAPAAAVASGAKQAMAATEAAAGTAVSAASRNWWPLVTLLFVVGLIALLLANRGGRGAAFDAAEQVRLASQRASTALAALRPGYTAQELVSALNLQVINFPPGSAAIPSESYELLNKTAVGLRSVPAGAVIEIAGHTDNTGNADANMTLSQQRADAVRAYLVSQNVPASTLVATGYGQAKPIASNDTDEGRFRNRRIEFAVR